MIFVYFPNVVDFRFPYSKIKPIIKSHVFIYGAPDHRSETKVFYRRMENRYFG